MQLVKIVSRYLTWSVGIVLCATSARYVRKTLSFSKRDAFHHMVTKWFIVDHNLAKQLYPYL